MPPLNPSAHAGTALGHPMIIPKSRIEREAAQAAQLHRDINAACPYPFDSDAGRLFKTYYLAAQETMKLNASGLKGSYVTVWSKV